MKRRRCVITGLGVLSPIGNSPEGLFSALKNGVCGIRRMEEWQEKQFDADKFLGAPVSLEKEFIKSIPRSARRSMSNISLYASYAAAKAIADAGLTESEPS